jgi:3-(3-hydroxy-phenyl)propionate hydroxylase
MSANPQVFSTPQPSLGPGAHDGEGAAGRIAPQPVLHDGSRLDDRVGYRFAVVTLPELAAAARDVAGEWACVVEARDPALREWLDGFGAAAVLRPDRYVAGTADGAAGLQALLRRQRARVSA